MQRKRFRLIWMIIFLCVFIFWAGIQMPESRIYLAKNIVDHSAQIFLTGLVYAQEADPKPSGQKMITRAVNVLFPQNAYMMQSDVGGTGVEDYETYQMILSRKENKKTVKKDTSVNTALSYENLISNFYTIDSSTSVTEDLLNAKKFLKQDMAIDRKKKGPKVLIYHTHSQEAFADSKKGDSKDTIMGVGAHLAKILNDTYDIETIHHEGVYDLIDGKMDRSKAYQLAKTEVEKILKENPSIEVVIDLHRDGVKKSTHLMTEINGKSVAQIMFFNGLSRTKTNGEIEYLKNPYIKENLAFSFQMQMAAKEKYPDFVRRIYLKSYRYNMHLKPKTLLIEAGAQTNTVEEMYNAMVILAEILDSVLNP